MAGYIFRAIFNHAEQLLLHEIELVSAFNDAKASQNSEFCDALACMYNYF